MKIVKVPLRISFFSGGTDLPEFYRIEKGAAFSATIDKYIYVCVHKTEDSRVHFSFSEEAEIVDSVSKMNHNLTKHALKHLGIAKGITIHSISDIKCQGTGLGASSAYTVGLINALDTRLTDRQVAELASDIEINRCGYHIGKQDQYAASFGGTNLFEFFPDESVRVNKHPVDRDLDRNLFLVDSGIERKASTILKKFKDNIQKDREKFEYTRKSRDLAYKAVVFLKDGKYDDFGDLLNVSWDMKKKINRSTSNPTINEYYDMFKKAGALGGKVLGAGGGGYMLFYVPKSSHSSFRTVAKKSKLNLVNFSFVLNGSRMLYNNE